VRGELGQLGVIQIQPVAQIQDPRYPARDCGYEYGAAGPYDPPRFGECTYPVSALTEMVKGAEQEHRIDRGVTEIQVACIAHRGMQALDPDGLVAELLDVKRHQITMLYPVAELG
jgi:hypothetical protein